MLNNARIRYFRESMETSLAKAKFSREEIASLIEETLLLLTEEMVLPTSFFDMDIVMNMIADKYDVTCKQARGLFVARPALLYEANGLDLWELLGEKPRLIIPPHNQIAEFAVNAREELGYWPQSTDGRHGIPNGYAGWQIIMADVRQRGLTLAKIVHETYPDIEITENGHFKKPRRTMPQTAYPAFDLHPQP